MLWVAGGAVPRQASCARPKTEIVERPTTFALRRTERGNWKRSPGNLVAAEAKLRTLKYVTSLCHQMQPGGAQLRFFEITR